MSQTIEVKVPDIGDFKDVPVIEVLVKPGDTVKAEDSLLTLESDKATMEVPSPAAGVVKEIRIKVGDKVSQGVPVGEGGQDQGRGQGNAGGAGADAGDRGRGGGSGPGSAQAGTRRRGCTPTRTAAGAAGSAGVRAGGG